MKKNHFFSCMATGFALTLFTIGCNNAPSTDAKQAVTNTTDATTNLYEFIKESVA